MHDGERMREKTMTLAEGFAVIVTAALTAVTGGFFRGIWKLFRSAREDFSNIRQAQCAMLRDRIVEAHDHYSRRGEVGTYALSALNELYRLYKQLGGNGFVDELMTEINHLEKYGKGSGNE